jgi:uncharacterized protein (DUF885 family)
MGSLKLRELREKAAKALGASFDIRKFHGAILGSGPMPLPILERHVEWWIATQSGGAAR